MRGVGHLHTLQGRTQVQNFGGATWVSWGKRTKEQYHSTCEIIFGGLLGCFGGAIQNFEKLFLLTSAKILGVPPSTPLSTALQSGASNS